MMANPEKDTLEGTPMNNGAPANAGAPGSKASSEVLDENLKAQAADAVASAEEGENGAASTSAQSTSAVDDTAAGSSSAGETAADAAAQAVAEAAEWKDKYIRLHAEWDTYRRRMSEQREEEKSRAAEKLVTSLLPVLDDLERTIDYAEKNGEQGLLGGVQAVLSKFVDILQKDGVQVIDPKGEGFNALEEQAVGTVPDPTQPDETVADVYQKGYKMGSKVLRPAMVTVTTGGPKRPPAEDAEGSQAAPAANAEDAAGV